MKCSIIIPLLFLILSKCDGQFVQWYNNIPSSPPHQFYQAPLIQQPQFFYQFPLFPNNVVQSNIYRNTIISPTTEAPTTTTTTTTSRMDQVLPQIQTKNTPVIHHAQSPAPAPTSLDNNNNNNYRGFGYHTLYNDGASATVVFFRGVNTDNQDYERITIASDSLDPQKTKDIEQQIRASINGPQGRSLENRDMSSFVRSFIENPQPLNNGLVYFYSNDNNVQGYPASTFPLNLNSTEEKVEAAESKVSLNLNSVDNDNELSSTTSTTTSTTSSTTTSTTTENSASQTQTEKTETTEIATNSTTEDDVVVVGETSTSQPDN